MLPPLPVEQLQQIDRLCADFETAWQTDPSPVLERLLDQVPDEARPELLRRLLCIEGAQRHRLGRVLTPVEARERFAPLGPWASAVLTEFGLDQSGLPLTLEVVGGPLTGRSFQLNGHTTFILGRGPVGIHLALEGDPGVSRVHFLIEYNPPRARLADLRSKNGTFVNDEKITEVDLKDRDIVRVGQTTIRVSFPEGEATRILGAPGQPRGAARFAREPSVPGYALEGELGHGGMGVVYRARRNSDQQPVAIKTIQPAIAPQPETLARFLREMTILQQLQHRNIIRFHESGEANGLLFFVMELVEGDSIAQVIKREGAMPVPRVIDLGCQLLDALDHAHQQGFVHRDVKPGNLLLTRVNDREVLKLADFGLARAYQASGLSGLTLAGTSGGTPEFMPPEQVLNFRGARPEADQYGVAATLYSMLTGQPIYEPQTTTLGLLWKIMTSEPVPLRPTAPPLPTRLGGVLRKALARQPRDRFVDVKAMREALASAG
jgi:serine/threonine-protein kinase